MRHALQQLGDVLVGTSALSLRAYAPAAALAHHISAQSAITTPLQLLTVADMRDVVHGLAVAATKAKAKAKDSIHRALDVLEQEYLLRGLAQRMDALDVLPRVMLV